MFLNPLWLIMLFVTLPAPSALDPFASPVYAAEAISTTVPAVVETASDPWNAAFPVTVGDVAIPFPVMAVFALPGEVLPIQVGAADPTAAYHVESAAGTLEQTGATNWLWTAPETIGSYPLEVIGPQGTVTANVFVMEPYGRMKQGRIDGYRIGAYPLPHPGRGTQSPRPRGFVEVTAANQDLQVSPHFRLGQFVCKEGTGFPKFVVLQTSLLTKLERVLERAQANGVEAETFHLMSAYRTPAYNLGIGNKTTFSRHQYGDAADIFVDESPVDGRMDDLNGDGRENAGDAAVLRSWAEQVERESGSLIGGLSAYSPTESHGPFVHVDARGYAARW